jgi:hypothetical protein
MYAFVRFFLLFASVVFVNSDIVDCPQAQNVSRHLGVDVLITIFCDICQSSAKKLAFFSKTNVMIKILQILALF